MHHRAYLFDRGAVTRIGEVGPLTRVRWGRTRDDTSSGNILIDSPNPECMGRLAEAEASRHELVVFRAGKRVWEGPIVRIADGGGSVEIDARDVTHYTNRTIMRSAYNNAYPRIIAGTERIRNILVRELARKEALRPPINVLPHIDIRTDDDTAKTTRATEAYEKYVFEELDSMAAKAGIDYTAIGRSIVVNDTHLMLGQGPLLTEADFDGPIRITQYGMETCTYSAVTDGQGKWGAFGGVDDYYGEIELLHTAFDQAESTTVQETITTAEMTTQAQRNLSGRYPTPMVLSVPAGSTLRPDRADTLMDFLVPGVWFPVRATKTLRRLTQMQKLDSVTFEETEAGETIKVTLSPAPGTTPWDSSGETSAGGEE
jgi:hypothetical protein